MYKRRDKKIERKILIYLAFDHCFTGFNKIKCFLIKSHVSMNNILKTISQLGFLLHRNLFNRPQKKHHEKYYLNYEIWFSFDFT